MSPVLSSPQMEGVSNAHFIPPPPQEAYFDSRRQAWVFSRYPDVQAALRHKGLYQASPRGVTFPASEDEGTRREMFARVRDEIAEVHHGRWRAAMESEAHAALDNVKDRGEFDLLGDVALPWSVAMLMKMSGASASISTEVTRIAVSLLYKKAFALDLEDPQSQLLRDAKSRWLRIEHAENALDILTAHGDLAISKMMFLAVAQSLPAFIAKAWLALLLNPDQLERLAEKPARMAQATGELLRYAGIVHTLHRKAVEEVQIGSARIAAGDRVELKVGSANFDPDRFEDPHQLDICRTNQSHLSFGAGLHACAGVVLVRQAFAAMTSAFLAAHPRLIEGQRVVCMGDSTLRWPLAVWVRRN